MVWHRIEPELYMHGEPAKFLHERSLEYFKSHLIDICSDYRIIGNVKLKNFEIEVEEGSLKAHILIPIAAILEFLAHYGDIRSGAEYLYHDVQTVYTKVADAVRNSQVFETEICVQRRLGVIGRIDYVLFQYEHGMIDRKECISKLIELFYVIDASPNRKELISALVKYIDNKYSNGFPWYELADYIQDKAILPEVPGTKPGKRNRRRG